MARRLGTLATALVLAISILVGSSPSAELLLKDGRVLSGSLGVVGSLAEPPQPAGSEALQLIAFVDDQLRRTFLSKRQIREIRRDAPVGPTEKFDIWQRVKKAGSQVNLVGPILRVDPFDEYGRRIFTMQTDKGPLDIVQGITELTPHWAKVEGISHVWDMRVAPSSIPTDVLAKILDKQLNAGSFEHQKKVARFYIQMQRYEDAGRVLQGVLDAHGDDVEVKQSIESSLRQLRQLSAQRLLDELKSRRDAGQHGLAREKLAAFPSEGVAGEILQEVRELLAQYDTLDADRDDTVKRLRELIAETDSGMRQWIEPIVAEIDAELGPNTLGRMAAFRLAANDQQLAAGEKLALAVSGWLLGSDAAAANLPSALSAYRVRDLVRRYLIATDEAECNSLLAEFTSEEASAPQTVARLLAAMKPPAPISVDDAAKPGYYELEAPSTYAGGSPTRYFVQLPPEYDPYRQYPTILTLHGAVTTPEQQIDWWAGDWVDGEWRRGQASRHGYIVVAPEWAEPHQSAYDYSAREHAAVLGTLRDACRRFSIDTDQVFLSGHSMGGNAAWDLGLAHPDLWAGVIPIVARSGRYCSLYWKNAETLPFYVVGGEKDNRWIIDNAMDLDRYLTYGFNTTVVEYQGRGHEDFHEEILRLFAWMKSLRRNFFPRTFTCASMRPWDNFFYWVELDDLPERAMVAPDAWPPPRGTIPMVTEAAVGETNTLRVRTGAAQATVWLSPRILNFDQRATVTVNGRRINSGEPFLKPDLRIMLEDARTRADRLHPFWARLDTPTGRQRAGR